MWLRTQARRTIRRTGANSPVWERRLDCGGRVAEGHSLINLGDLSKPATVLVEKVCNAVGIIYEPTRIRRRAHADADAEKIKALAQVELRDVERRALERLVHQEARKQENIEAITAQAASAL